MADEWTSFPDREDSSHGTPTGHDDSSTPPTSTPPDATNHDEDTRILPPHDATPDTAPVARRRTRALPAAVIAGALVVGGVAGVGGAAAYDAMRGNDTTTTVSNGGSATPTPSTPDISAAPANQGSPTLSSSSTAIESVASRVLPSVVQINVRGQSQAGSGSGIVLSRSGVILTNNHVVAVAGRTGSITANFNDGTSAKAKVLGTDPVTDLAVIEVQSFTGLTPAKIGRSSDLKVGQTVVAIGSPFGLGATVTSGIVSALNRAVSVSSQDGGQSPFGQQTGGQATTYPAIQTDAAINPGNSGGALVDLAGRVIGINSSIRTAGGSSTSSQSGSIGLGFAIPIDEALPIVNLLRNGQTPTHARLGVSVSNNNTSKATQTGALVKTVQSGGAAAGVGLKAGDVITKVDDQLIEGSDSMVATVRGHRPGDSVTLTYLRGGQTRTVQVSLGSDASQSTS